MKLKLKEVNFTIDVSRDGLTTTHAVNFIWNEALQKYVLYIDGKIIEHGKLCSLFHAKAKLKKHLA